MMMNRKEDSAKSGNGDKIEQCKIKTRSLQSQVRIQTLPSAKIEKKRKNAKKNLNEIVSSIACDYTLRPMIQDVLKIILKSFMHRSQRQSLPYSSNHQR